MVKQGSTAAQFADAGAKKEAPDRTIPITLPNGVTLHIRERPDPQTIAAWAAIGADHEDDMNAYAQERMRMYGDYITDPQLRQRMVEKMGEMAFGASAPAQIQSAHLPPEALERLGSVVRDILSGAAPKENKGNKPALHRLRYRL